MKFLTFLEPRVPGGDRVGGLGIAGTRISALDLLTRSYRSVHKSCVLRSEAGRW